MVTYNQKVYCILLHSVLFTRQPGSLDAELPGSLDAELPGSLDAELPGSLDADNSTKKNSNSFAIPDNVSIMISNS